MFRKVAQWLMFPGPTHASLREEFDFSCPEATRTGRVIFYSHGNAIGLDVIEDQLRQMATWLQARVVAYEYPGYEEGRGSTREQVNQAALDRLRSLIDDEGGAPERIVLMGRSIGTGPTAWLAAHPDFSEMQFASIVLWSPFSSINALGKDLLRNMWHNPRVPCWAKALFNPVVAVAACHWTMIGSQYDSASELAKVRPGTPIMYIHGGMDAVIPCTHTERLRLTRAGRVHSQQRATHNGFDESSVLNDILLFLLDQVD